MPKYQFQKWVEEKYIVTFVAENLEDAKKQMADGINIEDLNESEEFFKKGNEEWMAETLEEIEGETE